MTLLGVDVSHHQGTVDFAAVKRAGNSFVVAKATEGVGYTDPSYYANDTKARGAGLTVGAYHFASGGDPVAEADYFCSVVGALKVGDLVVLDWETTAPNPPAWCLAWLNRVNTKLGVRPLIYMNQSTRDGFDWSPVVTGNFGLWLAAYDGTTAVPGSGRWPAVAMKQFTSGGSVPGIAGACDRNVFFGDAAALAAYGYQESDMTPDDMLNATMIAADGKPYTIGTFIKATNDTSYHAAQDAKAAVAQVAALATQVTALVAAVNKLVATPIPAAQAAQVVDEMAKRLNTPAA